MSLRSFCLEILTVILSFNSLYSCYMYKTKVLTDQQEYRPISLSLTAPSPSAQHFQTIYQQAQALHTMSNPLQHTLQPAVSYSTNTTQHRYQEPLQYKVAQQYGKQISQSTLSATGQAVCATESKTLTKKSEFGSVKLLTQSIMERRIYFTTNCNKLTLSRVAQEEQCMHTYALELANKATLLQNIATHQVLDQSSQVKLENIQAEQANVKTYINQLQEKIEQLTLEHQQQMAQCLQLAHSLSIDQLTRHIDDLILQKYASIQEFNHKTTLLGFTSMALEKSKIQLDKDIDSLDRQNDAYHQVLSEKLALLSLDELKKLAIKLDTQIRTIDPSLGRNADKL